MRTLLLLRHAKSDWGDPDASDHERPLNKRGRRSAPLVGETLRERGLVPDVVVCSSAVRAQETLDGFRDAVGAARVVSEPRIYDASVAMLLECCRELPADADCALVIGHNPGIEELARTLAATSDDDAAALLAEGLPTAALVVLTTDVPWADLRPGTAHLSEIGLHAGRA